MTADWQGDMPALPKSLIQMPDEAASGQFPAPRHGRALEIGISR
jgi:hypothetical protein